jgi:glycosyltransferase involved in cell wall biosynthesis
MKNNISVVLAVYNGEKFLVKLLESLLAQVGVGRFELIVVDDCSTDGSIDIILKYVSKVDLILVKNDVNIGPIASFREGAKLATGDYIAFADQDDIWLNTKLSSSLKLIQGLDIFGKPSVVFHDLEMIDENDRTVNRSFWELYDIKPAKNDFFTLLLSNVMTGCAMMINRSMLNEFLKMPLNAEMHDHWIALIAASFGCWEFSEEKMVLYRIHQESVTLKNKDQRTWIDVVRNFIAVSSQKKSTYLNNYINQAILFKQYYEFKLDSRLNAQLDYVINLKKSSGLSKILITKYRFIFRRYLVMKNVFPNR